MKSCILKVESVQLYYRVRVSVRVRVTERIIRYEEFEVKAPSYGLLVDLRVCIVEIHETYRHSTKST